jgi:hypothetical protein
MPVWTVHAPPPPGVSAEPEDDVVFIREGFSWTALVFAPIWALAHRLWLSFTLWLVAAILISLVGAKLGGVITWPLWIGFLVWFGYEAADFRRARLTRRDWAMVDIIHAPTRRFAEYRYFEKRAEDRALHDRAFVATPTMVPPRPPTAYPPVIGYLQGDPS